MQALETSKNPYVAVYYSMVHGACDTVNNFTFQKLTPNQISYFRTFIGIVIAIPLFQSGYLLSSGLIIAFSLYLDHIDGVWARRYNLESRWGAYIDRTCDKILIITWMIYLLLPNDHELFSYLFIRSSMSLIAIAEFTGLAQSIFHWWIEYTENPDYEKHDNKAGPYGKIKMLLECVALFLIFFCLIFVSNQHISSYLIGTVLFVTLPFAGLSYFDHMRKIRKIH